MASDARRFKDSVYAQLARVGKALSAPKRLELLGLLCEAPRTVEALARLTALSVANTSQHLRVLLHAHLVESEKKGLFVEYRVADERVLKFLHLTHELAESRLAEIRDVTTAFLEAQGALEPVSSAELVQRVRRGEVTVLDVRPTEEYRAGHIPGALSVPLPELKARLAELPKRREIVAYCRGRYCVMAVEAVALLRSRGFRAYRMEQGVMDWRAQGWRIEKSLLEG
jgi:rhodanese-related sulfurtransferase/DNA-binding transcriptional ArsR family regulator